MAKSSSGFTWQELLPYGIEVLSRERLLRMKEHARLDDQANAEMIRRAIHPDEKP